MNGLNINLLLNLKNILLFRNFVKNMLNKVLHKYLTYRKALKINLFEIYFSPLYLYSKNNCY